MEGINSTQLKSLLEEFFFLTTMTLSTVGDDGEPHAAAVYFAAGEAINLYYFSETGSQHAQDTCHDPRAAVAIHKEVADWQKIQGLQMRGSIRPVDTGQEWNAAWQLYREKFPFVADLKELISINQLYTFEPVWIRMVDNRRGFGFKQEWELTTIQGGSEESQTWRIVRRPDG